MMPLATWVLFHTQKQTTKNMIVRADYHYREKNRRRQIND